MSKSILIIDTPENCEKCQLCSSGNYGSRRCVVKDQAIFLKDTEYKPDWCPFHEVPSKKEDSLLYNAYIKGKVDGYNACIDEIIK